MFQFKAKLFVTEIFSLMVAPYILCVSLAKCAEPICEFILATRTEVPGAGDAIANDAYAFEAFGRRQAGIHGDTPAARLGRESGDGSRQRRVRDASCVRGERRGIPALPPCGRAAPPPREWHRGSDR